MIYILIMIAVILLGYHEIFSGADFFTYKDTIGHSNYSYGNSLGNGWRPDKGFGTSMFYADPGMWHPWSLLTFWESLWPSQASAYSSSIILLGILATLAAYFLLRRVAPEIGGTVSCLLAPLIIFHVNISSGSYSRFQLASAIGGSLLLLVLHRFYQNPKGVHLLQFGLIILFTIFLGSFLGFSELLQFGLIFSITYWVYYKTSLKSIAFKFLFIFFVGGICAIVLGFWEFYSIILEKSLNEFLRAKSITFSQVQLTDFLPNIREFSDYLLGLFQVKPFPDNIVFLGLGSNPFSNSYSVIVIFPLIFIFFLFRRSQSFWEFSLKWMLLYFYVLHALKAIPISHELFALIAHKSYNLIYLPPMGLQMYLQLALIGIFIQRIKENDYEIKQVWGKRVLLTVGCLMLIYYLAWAVFCILALFLPALLPGTLSSLVDQYAPEQFSFGGGFLKELLVYVVWHNIFVLQESMRFWHTLVFFLL